MKSPVSRSVRAFGAALALATLIAMPASAGYRAVQVDTSMLPGGGPIAQHLRTCLASETARALGPRLTPGDRAAPTVILRPRAVQLAPMYGHNSLRLGFADGGASDYIEGDAVIVGSGRVGGGMRIPMLAAMPADFGGVMGAPTVNAARRVQALCQSFAHWIARDLAAR
jgi:hypothetical protein